MIVQEEFLKRLRASFDLNIYEVKIWTALLSRGIATAGELADISGVPRSRSYDVLESLEKRGFVITKIGKPIKYIAIKPDEIIKRVKTHIEDDSSYKKKMLDNVRDTNAFQELELLYKQGITNVDPNSLSGAIKGRYNIRNQMASLLDKAEKSVIIMTSPTAFVRKAEDFKRTFQKLKDKNVKIRIGTNLTEEAAKAAEGIANMAEVKHLDSVDGRFIVVDGQEILFMVDHDQNVHDKYDVGIWVNTPFFANAMQNMFDLAWKTSK